MILVGKTSVDDVNLEDLKALSSFKLEEKDAWKVPMVKEIIDIKADQLEVPGFELKEIEALLHHLCTE